MPRYEVTAPNGKRYEVNAPEGATPEQVMAYVRTNLAKQDKPADKPPAMFTALKGVAKGAAFPVDLALQGVGALADIASPGSGDTVRGLSPSAALDRFYPTPGNQRLVEDIFAGMGGAGAGVKIGGALARSGGKVGKVGQFLAAQPGLQTVAGGTAGLASGVAREGGAGPVGQIAAGVAGGFAPFSMASMFAGAGRSVLSPLSKDFAADQAARLMQEQALDAPAAAAAIEAARGRATVPGVQPLTAEVARDPGIAGLSRSVANNSVADGARITSRAQENMLAREAAVNAAAGAGDPEAVRAAAGTVGARMEQNVEGAVSRVGPDVVPEASGEALRKQLSDAEKAAKAAASARYQNLPGGDEIVEIGVPQIDAPPPTSDIDLRSAASFRDTMEGQFRAGPVDDAAAGIRAGGEGTLRGLVLKPGSVHPESKLGRELILAGYGPKQLPGVFSNTASKARELDSSVMAAQERGFLPNSDPNAPAQVAENDLMDALMAELRGERQFNTAGAGGAAEAAARNENFNAVAREFDTRGLDPKSMTADDWDAFYRDVNDLPPSQVTQADMEWMGGQADNAQGLVTLSPFQASLVALKNSFFPPAAGLPVNGAVGRLIGQVVNADRMTADEITRVARDLRQVSGALRQSDGTSAGLAARAADALEGFAANASGPDRAKALREARAGWREYSKTFREGEVGRVLGKSKFGSETLDAAKVPSMAVPRGVTGATAAGRVTAAAGPDAATQAAREEVRRQLGDVTKAADVTRIERAYADTLRAYPELARDVAGARETAAALDAFKASPFGRLRDTATSVDEVTRQAITARDNGTMLRSMIAATKGNDVAEAGLRRAIGNYAVDAGGLPVGAPTATGQNVQPIAGFRKRLIQVLKATNGTPILTDAQRGVFKLVREELDGAAFAASANRPAGSDTARNTGVALNVARKAATGMMQAAGGAKVSGAANMLGLLVEGIARAGGNYDQIGVVLREAMLDPELARALLLRPTPSNMKRVGNQLIGALEGSTSGATAAAGDAQ